jgi:TATA-box binding protein (TBP) (component of TFIID and TFIIIB)
LSLGNNNNRKGTTINGVIPNGIEIKYVNNTMSKLNIKKIVSQVVPLESLPQKPLHIDNVVGTVELLKPGQFICLETLSLHLNGMAKYQPKKFVATMLRIKDSISTTTCLTFAKGEIVVVGAKTKHHSLLACHIYRQFIERVPGIFEGENGGLGMYNLVNRTQFNHWSICNIVTHYNLQCKPDLKHLAQIAPEICDWNHELFPGLRLLVWINPKNKCRCELKKKKNRSCKCNCRAILFDTGKVVITGCETQSDVNIATQRIQDLFLDDDMHDKEYMEGSSTERFRARREKIIKAAYIEFTGWYTTPNVVQTTMEDDITIDYLLKGFKKQLVRKHEISFGKDLDVEPIIKACRAGQKENVEFLLKVDPNYAKVALESGEKFSNEIMKLLLF